MNAVIVVPSIGVDRLLERCITECSRQCPGTRIIALVDDGEGKDRIDAMAEVVVTGPITIAAKRNLGATMAEDADYLAFIDSDAYPADGWLQAAVRLLGTDDRWGAVGGPNVSPPEESASARLVGLAHNSFLVAGWWAYRRRPEAPARQVGALPSCNIVVRRDDYEAVGGMNELLFTAEDTDFCRRFTGSGRKILFTPEVLVFHNNRNLKHFVVQRFTFGVAMVPLLRDGAAPDAGYTGASALLALFVSFVAAGPLGVFDRRWWRLWRGVMTAYVALVCVEGFRRAERRTDIPGTILALAIGNLAPGAGFVLRALRLSPDLQGVYRNDR